MEHIPGMPSEWIREFYGAAFVDTRPPPVTLWARFKRWWRS